MKKIQLYLMLSVVVFATGCPKYRPKVDFDRNANTFVNKLNTFLATEQQRYINLMDRTPPDTAGAMRVRNDAIERVLPYIDSAYMDFITDLQAGRDRDNFVADLVELGGAAAVGIVNGERPLQIIGVGLTAIRGGRRSADLNFYKEQTTPVLITKMDGNRARVRAVILTREKDEVKDYSFGAAVSDIVDYYNAGTLVRAFTELQKDTANQTKDAEDEVLLLKGVRLSRVATPEERQVAVDARGVLTNLQKVLDNTTATIEDKARVLTKLQNIVAALENDPEVSALLTQAGVSKTETDGTKIIDALIDIRADASMEDKKEMLTRINQAIIDNGQ